MAHVERSAGNERSALRSRDANTLERDPSRFRNGRWFNRSSSSRIARLTFQPEELATTQGRNDPALNDMHSLFDLGL